MLPNVKFTDCPKVISTEYDKCLRITFKKNNKVLLAGLTYYLGSEDIMEGQLIKADGGGLGHYDKIDDTRVSVTTKGNDKALVQKIASLFLGYHISYLMSDCKTLTITTDSDSRCAPFPICESYVVYS